MSVYYVRGLIFEHQLDEAAKKPDKQFAEDLDEALAAMFKLRIRVGGSIDDLKKNPKDLGLDLSTRLATAWKKRAKESHKLLREYQKLSSGKQRDMLRAKLHRRGLKVA